MVEIWVGIIAVYMASAMVNLIGLAELKNTKIVDEEESAVS